MILLAYRHGLRVSEVCALRWEQIDFGKGLLHVRRVKNGVASTHPLHGPELRSLRRLQREHLQSPYVFTTERKGPLTDSTVGKIVGRAGQMAKLEDQAGARLEVFQVLERLNSPIQPRDFFVLV